MDFILQEGRGGDDTQHADGQAANDLIVQIGGKGNDNQWQAAPMPSSNLHLLTLLK
jgi:hypothetical protein